MDIIDVLVAKALTPQGRIETYAALAQKAVTDANTAVNNIETITEQTTQNNETAAATLEQVNAALADVEQALEDLDVTASINLGSQNKGKMVIVNDDGTPTASDISVDDIMHSLIQTNSIILPNVLGVRINYLNKTVTRIQNNTNRTSDSSFENFEFFRRDKCLVDSDGRIIAFGNQASYDENSDYNVMVYQPAFYYYRIPEETMQTENGVKITKEMLLLSSEAIKGFKLHPLFKTSDGATTEYALLSAYEGCVRTTNGYDTNDSQAINPETDVLCSRPNVLPVSGLSKNLTVLTAEKMAANIGSGWHITNIAAESAMQMLQIVEYATLNGQLALESGITNLSNISGRNCACLTGSTASFSQTGAAESSKNSQNQTFTEAGKRAIKYREFENPWGNLWRFVGGIIIKGDGTKQGGVPYICDPYNYDLEDESNYTSLNIMLPNESGYISGFAYINQEYDWVFIPIEAQGNDALPVGDQIWVNTNLNRTNALICGGAWGSKTAAGMFAYGCDQALTSFGRSVSARLMHIPNRRGNSVYSENVSLYHDTHPHTGGDNN